MHRSGITAGLVSGMLLLLLTLVGCSSATYQERLDYLRTVAQRGAETHALLRSQEARIDRGRCADAYQALQDSSLPPDTMTGSPSPQWKQQVEAFFVDSCVSGKPRTVPGSTSTSPAPPPTG